MRAASSASLRARSSASRSARSAASFLSRSCRASDHAAYCRRARSVRTACCATAAASRCCLKRLACHQPSNR
eukprot:2401933-Pleurochrysis_carterae.AAC.2